MKQLLVILGLFFLVACGSSSPFERGQLKSTAQILVGEKPSPTDLPPVNEEDPTPNPQQPDPLPPAPVEKPVVLDEEYFNSDIQPLLKKTCAMCHENPAPSFKEAVTLVVAGKPQDSALLQLAIGKGHTRIWAPESPAALKVAAWIKGQRL